MTMKSTVLLAVVSVVSSLMGASNNCLAAASYTYTDLGETNGYSYMTFNNNGQVSSQITGPGEFLNIRTYPGLYTISREYGQARIQTVPQAVAVFGDGTRVLVPPTQAHQGEGSYLFSVNHSGTFVGSAGELDAGGLLPLGQAISFSGPTGLQVVPTPNDGLAAAISINNAGMIVGQSGYRAFLSDGKSAWDLNTLIGDHTGLLLNTATDINDLGQILALGTYSATNREHYFLLTPTATPEPSTLALLSVGGLVYLARRRLGRSVTRV